jgi:protein AaeX
MRFAEINLFGVYAVPISVMMVGAWFVTIALRRHASRFAFLRYVWHPALFVFAVYREGTMAEDRARRVRRENGHAAGY